MVCVRGMKSPLGLRGGRTQRLWFQGIPIVVEVLEFAETARIDPQKAALLVAISGSSFTKWVRNFDLK